MPMNVLRLWTTAATMAPSAPSMPEAARSTRMMGPTWEPNRNVGVDGAPAAAAQPQAGSGLPQIAGHQHRIGRGEGDVGALRPHRHAHRADLQRQAVVDPVADDERAKPSISVYPLHLLLWQGLGTDVGDAERLADAARDPALVAGQQHLAPQAQRSQIGQGRLKVPAVARRPAAASPGRRCRG